MYFSHLLLILYASFSLSTLPPTESLCWEVARQIQPVHFVGCKFLLFSKEKLPNVDIRPDKDRIGPLFETRKDDIIGHLIVLLQYNWPKGALLFEQLAKIITTLGGLKYKQFFSYVSSILFSNSQIVSITMISLKSFCKFDRQEFIDCLLLM